MFTLLRWWKNLYYEFARALRSTGLLVYVFEKPLYIVAGNSKKQYKVELVTMPVLVLKCVKAFTLRACEILFRKRKNQRNIKEIYVLPLFALFMIKCCET